jgi:hypothetical protein
MGVLLLPGSRPHRLAAISHQPPQDCTVMARYTASARTPQTTQLPTALLMLRVFCGHHITATEPLSLLGSVQFLLQHAANNVTTDNVPYTVQ